MSMLSDALRFVRSREVVARQIAGNILPMISPNATSPVLQSRGGCSSCERLQIGQWAAYQPPQVVRESLRPEEAVLEYCKVSLTARKVCRRFGNEYRRGSDVHNSCQHTY